MHAVALLTLALLPGCRPLDRCCDPKAVALAEGTPAATAEPGVLLSFDDQFIDQWAAFADLVEPHGARATFFVTRMDYVDPPQLELLHDLQARGHEIACHGHRHLPAAEYAREHGVDAWVADELEPSLDAFAAAGFAPESYAFPYGEHDDATVEAALEHFDHVRGVVYVGSMPEVRDIDAAYLPASELTRRRFSCAVDIDARYGVTAERLDRALDRAAEHGEVLSLLGHEPAADAAGLQTDHDLLLHVVEGAAERDLVFHRYTDGGAP